MSFHEDKELLLFLTKECNQACNFCTFSNRVLKKGEISTLSFEEAKDLIDSGVRKGFTEILITGGEPTLHENLPEIVSYAKKNFTDVILQTNGIKLSDKEYLKKLINSGMDEVMISIHANTGDLSDNMTGVPGSFEETITGFRNCCKEGLRIITSLVVTNENYKKIYDTVKMIYDISQEEGVDTKNLEIFLGVAKPNDMNKDIIPRLSEIEDDWYSALEFLKEKGISVSQTDCGRVPFCYLKGFEEISDDLKHNRKIQLSSEGYSDAMSEDKTVKGLQCRECRYDKVCEGVWKKYADIYGKEELKPVPNARLENIPKLENEKREDLKLGYQCNNNCMFCIINRDKRCIKIRSKEEIFKDIAISYISGVRKILFTGGEPAIRDDILDIVEFARGFEFSTIHIESNGRIFAYRKFAEDIVNSGANAFSISFHAHNGESYSKITKTNESAFDQVVLGIKNLSDLGQKIDINCTINKINYKHIKDIIDILSQFNINSINFPFVNPSGNAWDNRNEVVPRISLVKEYLIEAIDYAKKKGIHVTTEMVPFCFVGQHNEVVMEQYKKNMRINAPDYFDENFDKTRLRSRAKSKRCKECKFDRICEGVTSGYAEIYGIEELEPIK